MKHLYYVRHGISVRNQQNVFAGSDDTPLAPEGRRQARIAGKEAKKLHIDYIVSSPLSRALETAQIIADEIGYPRNAIEVNQLFTERHFGILEGQPWFPNLDLDGTAEIETVPSLLERSKQALDFLYSLKAENVLVVGHGSFGRAIRHHLSPDRPYQNRTSNKQTVINNAEIEKWI